MPSSNKTKSKFLHFPSLFSPKTSRSPSPNPALSESSSAGIFTDAPGQKYDPQSQDNLLSVQSTPVASHPAVEISSPTSSHPSESSPHLSSHPEPKTSDKIKKGLGVALMGLKATLRLLEGNVDEIPPLKYTIKGLITILDFQEAFIKNSEEYEKIATELTSTVEILAQYVPTLAAKDFSGSVLRIMESINTELIHIKKQQDRGKVMRAFAVFEDKGDVLQRFRTIEALFRRLQSDITLRTWDGVRKQNEATLLENMSPVYEALYNSDYSTTINRGKCTAETREEVLEKLKAWSRDPKGAKIYWMNGIAGTGKTTISYTFCEWLNESSRLGADYFCSRASDLCRDVNRILPTLAHQLAQYSHSFRSTLCKVLEEKPGACKLNVEYQFQNLIQIPLQTIEVALRNDAVIVIDGLDECDDGNAFRLFLDTLLKLAINLPIKFFITSRPEPAIRVKMLTSKYSDSVLYLHDVEASLVRADIKKYLIEAFGSMSPVPSSDEVERLVEASGKLFIYAATAIRYICPGDPGVDNRTRLETVLGMVPGSIDQYDDLDILYTNILHAALYPPNKRSVDGERNDILLVLKTAVSAKEPMATRALASLLSLSEKRVQFALQSLQSVLHTRGVDGLIAPFHTSFPDFLLDECRSKQFHFKATLHNELLAIHCFDLMKKELRFNICDLKSSFVYDQDVLDLTDRIRHSISPGLSYACRYWGEHLLQGNVSKTVHEKLVDFLTHRLLFWMEVLNLSQCIEGHEYILKKIKERLTVSEYTHNIDFQTEIRDKDEDQYSDTMEQLADASNFLINLNGIRSTPHIYISKLAFCPKIGSIYKNYWRHTQGLIEPNEWGRSHIGSINSVASSSEGIPITPGSSDDTVRGWEDDDENMLTGSFNGHTSLVTSVAFSPNGTQIASGSYDRTIRVWTRNGNIIAGPFEGHTDAVSSVAFSPDGTQIASGSDDRTIRVWDARNGNMVAGPFEGHTYSVQSVAFSPDGTQIASGSNDRTIRVWDARNGNMVAGPFEGHTYSVLSVAFSPDGTQIASGSCDRTIRVWDARNGNMVAGPFEGHTNAVLSVAFSPDGTQIASGSDDDTIRVWDARNGNMVAGPFEGHTRSVSSVAFSPDGTQIASGSDDHTIRIWDARNGNMVAGPFEGHKYSVLSVAFSPDGTQIASGSEDYTIRIWDARNGNMVAGPFEEHTYSVLSVAFSPNGTQIASSSSDHTIRVWDAQNGNMVAGPFEGHTDWVRSVAFSPDGTQIASGSDDHTIRIWDARNGNMVADPFEGHTYSVLSVTFSPNGTQIASGSEDHTIRVWDARNGNMVAGPFNGHTHSVSSVAFSPDGTQIASGSFDYTIRVWDARDGNMVAYPFKWHTGSVLSVAFSPDGTQIASGSKDHTIRVWDVRNGDMVADPFEGHTDQVRSVAFSPNGTQIASGSEDHTIRVWDARNGNMVAGPFNGHTRSVSSVAFSPDGTQIASGSFDHTIRVWDARNGNMVADPFKGHTGPVASVAFSPNGTQIASGSSDDTIQVNDACTGLLNNSPGCLTLNHSLFFSGNLPVKQFTLHPDGWITADNKLLFWVPEKLHVRLLYAGNILVITPRGSVSTSSVVVDLSKHYIGDTWSQCYH